MRSSARPVGMAFFAAVAVPIAIGACTSIDNLSGGRADAGEADSSTPDAPANDDGAIGTDSGVDAPADIGDAGADAAADAGPPCDLKKPFGTPVLVGGMNSAADDFGARLAVNGTQLFFSSTRFDGVSRIYSATRTTSVGAFSAPLQLFGLTGTKLSYPTVSADGLTMYLVLDTGGLSKLDLYMAKRASAGADFGAPALALDLSSYPTSESTPYVLPSGKAVYYAGELPVTAPIGLYRADVTSDGTLANPQGVPGVSGGNLSSPVVTDDELTLYFASDRNIIGASGAFDIYVMTRASKQAAFGGLGIVTELNTAATEAPSYLTADGCTLYFSSTRGGGSGAADLYYATKPK